MQTPEESSGLNNNERKPSTSSSSATVLSPTPTVVETRPKNYYHLPSNTPYDLTQVTSNYTGRTLITRLNSIALICPTVAGPALTLALETTKRETLDVNLYETLFFNYKSFIDAVQTGAIKDQVASKWLADLKGNEVTLDRSWMEKTREEARLGLDRLEVELKGYTTNLIKESIRMGHRDLARFHQRTGDLSAAMRSYVKSREFCSTSQHVLEMCLGVIEVGLEQNNYQNIRNYVLKAETALEALNAPGATKTKALPSNMPGMVAPALDSAEAAKEKERIVTQERLTVAGAVANLGLGFYKKAARGLTGVGRETLNSSTVVHFIPPADIALYAVLTGLATFNRAELKKKILENPDLRPMLDLEPYLRDIVRAFYDSQFKDGLFALEKYVARPHLDIHISPHYNNLIHQITNRALLAYFSPFGTVSLIRMSEAFGWTENYTLRSVLSLIKRGEMLARVDMNSGVLVARNKDIRAEAFKNALEEGEKIGKREVAAHLRMRLIQCEVLVKGKTSNDSYV